MNSRDYKSVKQVHRILKVLHPFSFGWIRKAIDDYSEWLYWVDCETNLYIGDNVKVKGKTLIGTIEGMNYGQWGVSFKVRFSDTRTNQHEHAF